MFSMRFSREHSLRKRKISNVYSKSYLQSSDVCRDQSKAILCGRFLPAIHASTDGSDAQRGLDVYSLFLATTMDFISAYCYGLHNGTNLIQKTALMYGPGSGETRKFVFSQNDWLP